MQGLDRYAYDSKLRNENPLDKLLFSLAAMLCCLLLNSIVASVLVLMVMLWLTVSKGGTPLKHFIRLMLIPSTFLMISVITIALSITRTPMVFIFSIYIRSFYIGVTEVGLATALRVAIKAWAAISCLYFLSLTTPMLEVISALRRLWLPSLFLELMSLIYRMIFIFMETAQTIYLAQSSRLGYITIRGGIKSLGGLVSVLFLRSYRKAEELYIALESRGYENELMVLEEPRQHDIKWYIGIIGLISLLVALKLLTGR